MNKEGDNHQEVDYDQDGRLLVLTSIGVAALFGVSRQRISQLARAGKLPDSTVVVNGIKPGWLRSQFDTSRPLGEQDPIKVEAAD